MSRKGSENFTDTQEKMQKTGILDHFFACQQKIWAFYSLPGKNKIKKD